MAPFSHTQSPHLSNKQVKGVVGTSLVREMRPLGPLQARRKLAVGTRKRQRHHPSVVGMRPQDAQKGERHQGPPLLLVPEFGMPPLVTLLRVMSLLAMPHLATPHLATQPQAIRQPQALDVTDGMKPQEQKEKHLATVEDGRRHPEQTEAVIILPTPQPQHQREDPDGMRHQQDRRLQALPAHLLSVLPRHLAHPSPPC